MVLGWDGKTDAHGDRLLDRNIRRYLGLHGNRVNEAIRETLLTASDRPNFFFYNNDSKQKQLERVLSGLSLRRRSAFSPPI